MANGTIPYVAVVGGLWQLQPPQIDEARALARELGAEMAKAGLGLVVYFSADESLEPHVVAGYVAAMPAGRGANSIRVRYAESQRGMVKFPEEKVRRDMFLPDVFPSPDWEAPFYRSLVDAEGVDAVLLMSGHRSTLIAGQIAVARPLPVLAVDTFGGSAGVIWSELAKTSTGYPSASTNSPTQLVQWLKARCDDRVRMLREAKARESAAARVASQTEKSRWAAAAFVVLLVTFFFAMVRVPNPNMYALVMFSGLIAGGATGSLVRATLMRTSSTSPTTSLILGSIAGFVVGIAYLIPIFVGAPGVLDPARTVIDSNDKIQYLSSLLVAISAGVGFDTVFTRLKKQADDVKIGPPGP